MKRACLYSAISNLVKASADLQKHGEFDAEIELIDSVIAKVKAVDKAEMKKAIPSWREYIDQVGDRQ